MWRTPWALAASRGIAATARDQTITATGCAIRQVEEHDLIFGSVRKA
jgi:hypothetical protein